MDFFPGSSKQNCCLVNFDIPGICDFINKETEENGDEGLEIIDDLYDEVIDEETNNQGECTVNSSYADVVNNTAEKIEVLADVHEQFEQNYKETNDVDGIVNVTIVIVLVRKSSVCNKKLSKRLLKIL